VNSYIHDNSGAGIVVAPKNAATGLLTAKGNDIHDNGCGITAGSFGLDAAFNFGVDCAMASSLSGINGTATVFASHNSFTDSTNTGVLVRGGNAVIRMSNNDVTRSTTIGIRAFDSARLETWGNNVIGDNGPGGTNNGTFSGAPIPLLKPARP
jgi:hypothetical protein